METPKKSTSKNEEFQFVNLDEVTAASKVALPKSPYPFMRKLGIS